jgi:hypothetical protein
MAESAEAPPGSESVPPPEAGVKHFSEAQWADFARNVVATTEKMEMQEHIQNGCQRCGNSLQLWQNVLSIAAGERAFTPPGETVRVVKSQFGAGVSQANRGFCLLFDSSLQPAAAGIRGSFSARQFLYETEEYYIDLRIEPRREADRACLVGQILTRKGTDRAACGVAVRIQEGKRPLAETTANRFGEFQLEFDGTDDLCISIGGNEGNEGNEIVLPLYGVQPNSFKTRGLH